MKLVVRPAARRDVLLQIAHYMDEFAFSAAERFAAAAERAMEQVRKRPGIGTPRTLANPRLEGLRSWPIPGFEDFRIYYLQPERNLVRIVRILHGKRDLARILTEEEG